MLIATGKFAVNQKHPAQDWCIEQDLNLQCPKAAGLQPAGVAYFTDRYISLTLSGAAGGDRTHYLSHTKGMLFR